MSVIKLKKLVLKNFKGIKSLTVDFENITNIYGENKLGKSTIFDGFTWLLFDKDSKDRSKFEIQPLDKFNNVNHMVETQVVGTLEVDGKIIELKKILKEKWVKKRGEVDSDIKGCETLHYINEVPLKQSEYKEKIGSIIDEKLFKLISNPIYFSSIMKWQDRRTALLDIIGDIKAENIINYNPSLEPLRSLLMNNDLDSLKKLLAVRKKKLNEDKKSIPFRIDELNNCINNEVDFQVMELRKGETTREIKNIEEKLMDSSSANSSLLKEKQRLYELKSKLSDIEYKAKEEWDKPLKQLNSDLREIENEIYRQESVGDRVNFTIENNKSRVVELEKLMEELRAKWQIVDEEELIMSENQFICPTCHRAFEALDIEAKKQEMEENFNKDKAKRLEEINNTGQAKKESLEKLLSQISDSEAELEAFNAKLRELKADKLKKQKAIDNFNVKLDLSKNPQYERLKVEIEELEEKLKEPQGFNENTVDLKAKKKELEDELEEINNSLSLKEQNIKTKARITELMQEEISLSERIADLENQENLCEKYMKTKVELLEAGINSKFKFVKFKLLNTLVNGAVEECCEALIDGVPFSNANTAAQINAGIDIINTLCEYYKISAPIFIDNRESINEILDCNSQIINLIVSKDKKLVIEKIAHNNLEKKAAYKERVNSKVIDIQEKKEVIQEAEIIETHTLPKAVEGKYKKGPAF